MLEREQIKRWVEEILDGTDRFVVDVVLKNEDMIYVFLDSDTALTIDHCVEVSRTLETKLNRDEQDYELRVSSAGLDHPLNMPRQYVKNIGRKIRLEMKDGISHLGKITEAGDEAVTIELIHEKKHKKIKQEEIGGLITVAYSDIKEGWPVISFT